MDVGWRFNSSLVGETLVLGFDEYRLTELHATTSKEHRSNNQTAVNFSDESTSIHHGKYPFHRTLLSLSLRTASCSSLSNTFTRRSNNSLTHHKDSNLQLPVPPDGDTPHNMHLNLRSRHIPLNDGQSQRRDPWHILEGGPDWREVEPVRGCMLPFNGCKSGFPFFVTPANSWIGERVHGIIMRHGASFIRGGI
jgi:hypothetical protein